MKKYRWVIGAIVLFTVVSLVFVKQYKSSGSNPDRDRARTAVEKVGEVQNFKRDVEEGKRSTFDVRVDRSPSKEEPYYVVQVYEIFPDHMTTFNWYRVHPKTWTVERQNLVDDTWTGVQ